MKDAPQAKLVMSYISLPKSWDIGGAALAAATISEAERLAMIAARLPVHEWPRQRLVLNAVDAQTGAWVTFEQQAGVPLVLAVAASCAVPGIYPPTTIHGHRYMDGGMRSGTNADLAQGYDRVLILFSTTGALSASAGQRDPIHRVTFDDELALLKHAGAQVLVVTPDEAAAAAGVGSRPKQAACRDACWPQASSGSGVSNLANFEHEWWTSTRTFQRRRTGWLTHFINEERAHGKKGILGNHSHQNR